MWPETIALRGTLSNGSGNIIVANGTRDPFCDRNLMQQVLSGLGTNWRMHWVEGADHSFHVLKTSGRTDREVLTELANETDAWLAGLWVLGHDRRVVGIYVAAFLLLRSDPETWPLRRASATAAMSSSVMVGSKTGINA